MNHPPMPASHEGHTHTGHAHGGHSGHSHGGGTLLNIGTELRAHIPFTLFGTVAGIVVIVLMVVTRVPHTVSEWMFWTFHPLHVLFSAVVTAGLFSKNSPGRPWATLAIGFTGAVGIGTLSDSLLPYLGELLLALPHSHAHIGFIEMWWLVNPLAIAGVAIGYFRPWTKVPHAGHVLLSTWASLFHMAMAFGNHIDVVTALLAGVFLFIAVWVPCCTSDIVFPMLFARKRARAS
jgi:hypothetical protein